MINLMYVSTCHRCNCADCILLSSEDSLLYSYSRINAYRALSSPCLISLSSKDPILTTFELSWALRRLSKQEHEFKSDYEVSTWLFKTNTTHTKSSREAHIVVRLQFTSLNFIDNAFRQRRADSNLPWERRKYLDRACLSLYNFTSFTIFVTSQLSNLTDQILRHFQKYLKTHCVEKTSFGRMTIFWQLW